MPVKKHYEPTNAELRRELHQLSEQLYGVLGLTGIVAPAWKQWSTLRPDGWPRANILLRWYGLDENAAGWQEFVSYFNMSAPDRSLVDQASWKHRHENNRRYRGREEEVEHELPGEWVVKEYYDWGRRRKVKRKVFVIR